MCLRECACAKIIAKFVLMQEMIKMINAKNGRKMINERNAIKARNFLHLSPDKCNKFLAFLAFISFLAFIAQ